MERAAWLLGPGWRSILPRARTLHATKATFASLTRMAPARSTRPRLRPCWTRRAWGLPCWLRSGRLRTKTRTTCSACKSSRWRSTWRCTPSTRATSRRWSGAGPTSTGWARPMWRGTTATFVRSSHAVARTSIVGKRSRSSIVPASAPTHSRRRAAVALPACRPAAPPPRCPAAAPLTPRQRPSRSAAVGAGRRRQGRPAQPARLG